MNDLTMTVQKLIPAPARRIYEAWLNPDMMRRFLFAGQDVRVSLAETDPRVGGHYKLVMSTDDKDIPHTGVYLELVPHSRIAFTWESSHSVEGSTVTLDLTPEGDGTLVTLTHVRFASPEMVEAHRGGWSFILENLSRVAV